MGAERRLLVFGGTGFLGWRICEQAVASGWELHPTYFSSANSSNDLVTWHRCDFTVRGQARELIQRVQPTHIINAAYRQGGDDVHAICADAPVEIAAEAEHLGSRFVHVSTDLVFDGNLGRPYTEDDEVSPLGIYGRAKADAEKRVARACPTAAIARTSLIYGRPTAPQERLTMRAHDEAPRSDIAFFIDEWRTPVHVDDLAAVLLHLVESSDANGLIHVAGGERLNRLEFARLLAFSLGLDSTKLRGSTQDPALGPRPKDVSLNTELGVSLGYVLPGPSERFGAT